MFNVLAATASSCSTIFKFGDCVGLKDLLNNIVDSFFAVVWVIAIAFLAYGGLLFITSAGDKTKAETAKNALTQALIGIAIILSINVIVSLIGNVFGGTEATINPSIGASIPQAGKYK